MKFFPTSSHPNCTEYSNSIITLILQSLLRIFKRFPHFVVEINPLLLQILTEESNKIFEKEELFFEKEMETITLQEQKITQNKLQNKRNSSSNQSADSNEIQTKDQETSKKQETDSKSSQNQENSDLQSKNSQSASEISESLLSNSILENEDSFLKGEIYSVFNAVCYLIGESIVTMPKEKHIVSIVVHFFETLELTIYERLSKLKYIALAKQQQQDQSESQDTSSNSEEDDVLLLNQRKKKFNKEISGMYFKQAESFNLLISALVKTSARCPDLAPRVVVCLVNILNKYSSILKQINTFLFWNLSQRANQWIRCLRFPSIASSLFIKSEEIPFKIHSGERKPVPAQISKSLQSQKQSELSMNLTPSASIESFVEETSSVDEQQDQKVQLQKAFLNMSFEGMQDENFEEKNFIETNNNENGKQMMIPLSEENEMRQPKVVDEKTSLWFLLNYQKGVQTSQEFGEEGDSVDQPSFNN